MKEPRSRRSRVSLSTDGYRDYNSSANPSMPNEFVAAVWLVGRSPDLCVSLLRPPAFDKMLTISITSIGLLEAIRSSTAFGNHMGTDPIFRVGSHVVTSLLPASSLI